MENAPLMRPWRLWVVAALCVLLAPPLAAEDNPPLAAEDKSPRAVRLPGLRPVPEPATSAENPAPRSPAVTRPAVLSPWENSPALPAFSPTNETAQRLSPWASPWIAPTSRPSPTSAPRAAFLPPFGTAAAQASPPLASGSAPQSSPTAPSSAPVLFSSSQPASQPSPPPAPTPPPEPLPSSEPGPQPSTEPAPSTQAANEAAFRSRPINLGIYRSKTYPDGTQSKSIGLVYWHSIGKQEGWRLLAPAFFHYWSHPTQRDLWIYPLGYSYQNESGKQSLLGPVYRRHTGSERRTVVFPLYWRTQDPAQGTDSLTLGPYYRRRTPSAQKSGLAPFVFASRQGETRSLTVFPVFYRETSPVSEFLVTPLGFFSWEEGKRGRGLVGPLYLSRGTGENGPERTTALIPLLMRHTEGTGATSSSWTASPLFYSSRWHETTQDGTSGEGRFLLTPLGYAYRSDAAQERSFLLLNLWRQRLGEETKTALFPLFYRSQSPEQARTIAPLFYDRRQGSPEGLDYRRFTYALAGWRFADKLSETRAFGVANFFYSSRPREWRAGLAPLLFLHGESGGYFDGEGAPLPYQKTSVTLLPLGRFSRETGANGKRSNLLLGPLWIKRSPNEFDAWILPIARVFRETVPLSDEYGASAPYVRSRAMLFPLVFSRYDSLDQKRWLSVGPLFYSAKPTRTQAGLFPLVFAGKRRNAYDESLAARWLYALPAFYHQRGDEVTAGLAPLAWYATRGEKNEQSRSGGVLPLFYAHRSPTSSAFVSLPFGHTARNLGTPSERAFTWAGPALWSHSPNRRVRLLLPLFYDVENTQYNERTTLLLPLAARHRAPGERFLLLGGLYWHSIQETASGETERLSRALLPLYVHHEHGQGKFSTTVLGPVYWHQDPRRSISGVFPLAWYRSDRDDQGHKTQRLTLLPLLYAKRGPELARLVTPLGFYRRDADESRWAFLLASAWDTHTARGSLLFPFYLHRTDKETQSTALVSPLFARYARPVPDGDQLRPGRALLIAGLFWHTEHLSAGLDDAPRSRMTALAPLFFHKETPERETTVLFPLYAKSATPRASTETALGLYWRRSATDEQGNERENKRSVLPLIFWGKKDATRYQVVFPLLWHQRNEQEDTSRLVAGPYYQSRAPGYTLRGLFPLVRSERLASPEGETRRVAVAPLFWYRRDATQERLITPLGFFQKTPEQTHGSILSGYFWNNAASSGTAVWPVYAHWQDKRIAAEGRAIIPLWMRYTRPVSLSANGGFPLQRTVQGSLSIYGGLVWRGHHLGAGREVSPGVHFTSVLPLVFVSYNENTERRAVTVAPFFWRRAPGRYEAGLFPLVWFGERRDYSGDFGAPEELTEIRRHQILFPLFIRTRSVLDDESFTSAGLLFWLRRSPRETQAGFFPVARFSRVQNDEGGTERKGYVFPFFSYASDAAQARFSSLPFSYSRQKDSTRGRVLLALWERGPEVSKTALLPLFFHEREKETRTTATLLPLPFYRQSKGETARTTALFPFFYRAKDEHTSTLLTPLVYASQTPERRALYAFPALYWRNTKDSLRAGFWPLVRAQWNGTGYQREGFTYAFPFFLHQKGFDSWSLLTPLSWYQREGERRSFWSLLYYRERERDKKIDVLAPLFYRSATAERTWTVLAPLFVGYQRPGLRVRAGLPLLLDIKTDRSRVQLATPLFIHTDTKKAERWRFLLLWSFTRYHREYYLQQGIAESALTDWELRLSPFFKYTKDNPQSFQWKALGLFGFERNGAARRMFLFGVPFTLKNKASEPQTTEPDRTTPSPAPTSAPLPNERSEEPPAPSAPSSLPQTSTVSLQP